MGLWKGGRNGHPIFANSSPPLLECKPKLSKLPKRSSVAREVSVLLDAAGTSVRQHIRFVFHLRRLCCVCIGCQHGIDVTSGKDFLECCGAVWLHYYGRHYYYYYYYYYYINRSHTLLTLSNSILRYTGQLCIAFHLTYLVNKYVINLFNCMTNTKTKTTYKLHILKSIFTVRSIESVVRNFHRKSSKVPLFQFLVGHSFINLLVEKKIFTFPQVFDKKIFRPIFKLNVFNFEYE